MDSQIIECMARSEMDFTTPVVKQTNVNKFGIASGCESRLKCTDLRLHQTSTIKIKAITLTRMQRKLGQSST